MFSLLNSFSTLFKTFIKIFVLCVVYCLIWETNGHQGQDYVATLISKCGYPYEIHSSIQTEDGYLLTMQRIPGRSKEYENGRDKMPVLLMHGLLGSAEHFVLLGCTESLGFMLADEGYDVWLGNVRTVSYSRNHVSLDPDDREYWQITLDEFGTYDLPTFIDYILQITQQKQIMYIGHSQGNTIYYIMCSNKPEYAKKVQLFVNLSPVGSLAQFPHPWLPLMCLHLNALESFVDRTGLYELTLGRDLVRKYGGPMCSMLMGICKSIVYFFSGLPPTRLTDNVFQRLLTNCPEGIAAKQIIHGCQMLNEGVFRKYDYGLEENLVRYGTSDTPKYNLSLTTTPTAVYFCKNDWFLSNDEARKVVKEIPNVVDVHEVTAEEFTHFDFIISHLAPEFVYPRVLALMNTYRNQRYVYLAYANVRKMFNVRP